MGLGDQDTLLFVYGTLKRGQSNHGQLRGARWLGQASLRGFCLYDLGPFPMAIAGEGTIKGEIVALPWEALEDLDVFEGCPRLYQRSQFPLLDGRLVWVYVGHPRQVRHVPRLPGGEWPAPRAAELPAHRPLEWARGLLALSLGLLQPLLLQAQAFDTLAACQAWRNSQGLTRIELANAIGVAHALTKKHPFQESSPQAPVALYSPTDIQRVCRFP